MKREYIVMGEYRKAGGFGGKKAGGFGGGRPSFGGGRPSFHRGGDRENGPREMFPATCSSCHKSCEIPFRPSGERLVYCRDCFGSEGGSAPDTRGRRDDRGSESRFVRQERTPSFATPKPPIEDKRIDGLKRQLDDVSAKVDQILRILSVQNTGVMLEGKSPKKQSNAEAVEEVIQSVVADIKTAKKVTKKKEAPEKKVVKKKLATKKA